MVVVVVLWASRVYYYELRHGMGADMEGSVREEGLRRRCAMPFRALAMIALLQSFQTMSDCSVLLSLTKNRPGTSVPHVNCYIVIAFRLFVELCLVLTSHGSLVRCLHGDLKRNGLRYY